MKKLVKKYKKYLITLSIGLILILVGLLSWELVFSKYYIFSKEEKKFTDAAKRYYEYHKQYLPKKGEYRELTLQDLYDQSAVDDLFVPKSRKMCDTSSWVRVYLDEDGKYQYITYLKCGKYQSKTDHEGPVITLNGDKDITLALNSTYEELGVLSVLDNKDNTIDPSNVIIDSSKVDITKVGEYKVTYTVRDSSFNKTVLERNVTVIKGLTDTVRENTSEDGYYKGNVLNNYVLFSGMLWRIVRVNEDGTVRLILRDAVTNLRVDYKEYKDSNVDLWFNNVFLNALSSKDYLVDSTYCVGNINSISDYANYCSDSITSKIGLLDIDEYSKTISGDVSSVYFDSFMLGNKIGDNSLIIPIIEEAGSSNYILAPIRPVITLNNGMKITSGDGTISNPYKLDDYKYANNGDALNTRLIGEYLTYSGINFRIIGIDKDNNVRVIMDDVWKVQPDENLINISTGSASSWVFNLDDENNYGYLLNNRYLDYIDTKYIKDTTYEVPVNDSSKKYNEYETTEVKAKILLPKTYELFSTPGGGYKNMCVYIDASTNSELLFMANGSNGKVFEINKNNYSKYPIKAVLTLDGTLKIKKGKGTINNPYTF